MNYLLRFPYPNNFEQFRWRWLLFDGNLNYYDLSSFLLTTGFTLVGKTIKFPFFILFEILFIRFKKKYLKKAKENPRAVCTRDL